MKLIIDQVAHDCQRCDDDILGDVAHSVDGKPQEIEWRVRQFASGDDDPVVLEYIDYCPYCGERLPAELNMADIQ